NINIARDARKRRFPFDLESYGRESHHGGRLRAEHVQTVRIGREADGDRRAGNRDAAGEPQVIGVNFVYASIFRGERVNRGSRGMGKDIGRMTIQMDEPSDCERAEIHRRDSHAILICDEGIAGERLAPTAAGQNGGGAREKIAAIEHSSILRGMFTGNGIRTGPNAVFDYEGGAQSSGIYNSGLPYGS